LACPPFTCNLTNPEISFAIVIYFLVIAFRIFTELPNHIICVLAQIKELLGMQM